MLYKKDDKTLPRMVLILLPTYWSGGSIWAIASNKPSLKVAFYREFYFFTSRIYHDIR